MLDEDNTIDDFEDDNNLVEEDFHRGLGDMFPLARVTSAVETVDEQRRSLLERNKKLLNVSANRSHRSLGLKCMGPSRVVDNIVSRLCPLSATLGYDTTVLKIRRASKKTTMPHRCIACQAEYLLECQLEKYNLKATSRDQTCERKKCFEAGFGGSRFCKDHLSGWTCSQVETDPQQLQMLQNHLFPALRVVWTDEPAMGSVPVLIESIQAGKSPVSALRFIDLEYNSSTRRVFEIGMCDANGTVTMDCLTLYGSGAFQAVTEGRTVVDTRMDHIIESSVGQHHCTHGSMTAKQVANELRLQGISQETIFVSWHCSALDLSLLREWLESEREYGVLPSDSHCIPIIPYFRRNLGAAKLENGRDFPLSLPTMFPIMMTTRHVLYGRNHHAVVDAQQLKYMTDVFGMLCRPPQDRPDGWLEHLRHTSSRPGLYQAKLESFWTQS
ncbi:hypothetical protein DL768_009484 [Monosporascus sp. mg162]|nr:hypothetical protein DL768_009484 [Monosporascus sp. mg162]